MYITILLYVESRFVESYQKLSVFVFLWILVNDFIDDILSLKYSIKAFGLLASFNQNFFIA